MKNEEEESPFFRGSNPKKRKLSWRLPAFVDKYNLKYICITVNMYDNSTYSNCLEPK